MPTRSQEHLVRTGRAYVPPPITGLSPDVASIAAVGVIDRVVATMSVVGGTAPITYAVVNAAGLTLAVAGNELRTAADPVGTAGVKAVQVSATDSWGKTLTETITVTVT